MLGKYVASILNPLVGNIDSFNKDSKHFVDLIKDDKDDPNYLIVIFYVVSLFTKIHTNEAIEVVKGVTNPHSIKFDEICLRSTFFSFQGELFEQATSVAMGSPLSPIVSNIYM